MALRHLQGAGSAREIARFVTTDSAYGWIVGDMGVSHQLLSRFRVGFGEPLSELMTQVLGSLMHKGVLDLDVVAQDGTRIRASASPPSFRKEASLQDCLEQAQLHLKAVLAAADDPELSAAQKAAREALPRALLADANHVTFAEIARLEVQFIAPVPKRIAQSAKPHADLVDEWIERMGSDHSKSLRRARASLCELANAHLKARFGLDRVVVRGAANVTCVVLLAALTFNLLQHAPTLLA